MVDRSIDLLLGGGTKVNPAQTITMTSGIPSAEAWGSDKIAGPIKGAGGIASREAWGTPKLSFTIHPSGIVSREAWGSDRLALSVKPGGIASREAWGSPRVGFQIHPSGIASAEAWGSDKVGLGVRSNGVPSAEAWGHPTLENMNTISPPGIVSAEAWGSDRVGFRIHPGGVPSAEAWGTPRLNLTIRPSGIPSAEAWGSAIAAGPVIDHSIPSAEAWGLPRMGLGIRPTGIPSAEAWGSADAAGPVISAGIPSAEAWGAPHMGFSMSPWDRERGGNQMRLAPITQKAIGSILVVDGAHLLEGDSFVLNDGDPAHTPTSFMYFRNTLAPGFVGIHFYPTDDAPTIKGATIAAINGVGRPLSISAGADPGLLIALENDVAGEQGNQPITESVADPGFLVDGMRGGAMNAALAGIPSAPEGSYVFVLGYQVPGLKHLFKVGDFAEVSQDAEFGSTKIVRARVIVRPSSSMPAGTAWRFSIRIDGAERVGRTLEPGRGRNFLDLAANVSGLTGTRNLAFRVELILT